MNRVAITGIGAITPLGNDKDAFWNALKNGECGIGPITKFDPAESRCHVAAEVKNFDAKTMLDKSTAYRTDPFVQYAMCASDEAMRDSGLAGNVDPDRFGVYMGSGVGGIQTLCENDRALETKGARFVNALFVPKMIINIAAGQLAIRHGAHGNTLCLSTACATGSTAIGEAYRAIKDGYLTAAIAGGSEAAINPLTTAGFINCTALTQEEDPNCACVPFDSRRAGFVLGEGSAVLILEEYEHAVSRGAKIYAEIVGYGATCDAYHVTSPSPDGVQIARAIRESLSGVEYCCEKMYVNAHGTGTQLNDLTETSALKKAFGEDAKKLRISSTKSMTGHMLGAAGAAEAIAAVMALKEGVIPPTVHLECPDPQCDLNYTPNKAVKADPTVAISTSLGFGGHNACLAFKKVSE
ncbi:MAG: beta-ketoacyl-ACP synthase II [Eubacteriales bacterium]